MDVVVEPSAVSAAGIAEVGSQSPREGAEGSHSRVQDDWEPRRVQALMQGFVTDLCGDQELEQGHTLHVAEVGEVGNRE